MKALKKQIFYTGNTVANQTYLGEKIILFHFIDVETEDKFSLAACSEADDELATMLQCNVFYDENEIANDYDVIWEFNEKKISVKGTFEKYKESDVYKDYITAIGTGTNVT